MSSLTPSYATVLKRGKGAFPPPGLPPKPKGPRPVQGEAKPQPQYSRAKLVRPLIITQPTPRREVQEERTRYAEILDGEWDVVWEGFESINTKYTARRQGHHQEGKVEYTTWPPVLSGQIAPGFAVEHLVSVPMYWIEECGWDTSSLGVVRCEWSDNREDSPPSNRRHNQERLGTLGNCRRY